LAAIKTDPKIMKHLFFISLLLFSAFVGQGQSKKIDNSTVWYSLYPSNNNFDNDNRLIRKVNRDGAELEFRTEIGKIFYYKIGTQQKASVILFSYDYTSGEKSDCHACSPEFEVANFILTNNTWTKQKFVQNWKESTGSWGEPADLKLKVHNKINCLELSLSYGNQGNFETTTTYYNIETLKKVK
jgi:hypothetical protein